MTSELIFQVLKHIREDVAHIRRRIENHDEQFNGTRRLLVAKRSEDLRLKATIAGLRVDLQTIRRCLSLADA